MTGTVRPRRWDRWPRPVVIQRCMTVGAVILAVIVGRGAATAKPLEKTTRKGPVEAIVTLQPADPLIGDPVTYTLRVTAEKGVELIMPGFGQVLERFAILDFRSGEQIDEKGRTIVTHQYQLQPPRSGRQSIPPILVEFVDRRGQGKPAPDGMDAYELLTERVTFEVASVLPDDAKADLHPPLGLLPRAQPAGGPVWPWAVGGAVVVVGAGVTGLWLWAQSRRRARQRSAYEIASARLSHLLTRPRDQAHQVGDFFVDLSGIVRQYLEDRFELRAPELTTEEFLVVMSRSEDLSSHHQTLLREFLGRADLVKFANVVPAGRDIDESVQAARRFLEETRHETPMGHGAPPLAA